MRSADETKMSPTQLGHATRHYPAWTDIRTLVADFRKIWGNPERADIATIWENPNAHRRLG